MKTILIALLSVAAFAQTVPISVPGAGEPSVNVVFNSTAVSNLAANVTSTPASTLWPNVATSVPQSTTTTSAMGTTDTTAALASVTGISVCNGLLIDSEAMLVTGVAPLVLQRHMVGTAAAAHAANAPVTVLRTGSYTCLLKSLWVDQVMMLIQSKMVAAAAVQSQASLAAQTAAIAAVAAGAVQ